MGPLERPCECDSLYQHRLSGCTGSIVEVRTDDLTLPVAQPDGEGIGDRGRSSPCVEDDLCQGRCRDEEDHRRLEAMLAVVDDLWQAILRARDHSAP